MDDFRIRGAISFTAVSVAIIGISQSMIAAGTAVNGNPAWTFISPLRSFFIWSWVLLLALAIGGFFVILIFEALENENKRKEMEAQKRRMAEETLQCECLRHENLELEAERHMDLELKRKCLEEEAAKNIELEKERKRHRAASEAIEDSLKDFL